MRRIGSLFVSLAVGLGLVFLAAPAAGATSLNVGNGSCPSEQISQGSDQSSSSQRWTANGCGWYQRPKIYCAARGGANSYNYGGWVRSGITSAANCPATQIVVHVWIQWKHNSTGTVYSFQVF